MINSIFQKHSFLHRAFQRRKIWGVRPIWKKSTRWSRHLQVVGYATGDFERIGMAAGLFISGANSGRRRSFRQGWEFYWKWRAGKLLREPAGEESRKQSQILERLENQDNYSFVFCPPPTLTVGSLVCMRWPTTVPGNSTITGFPVQSAPPAGTLGLDDPKRLRTAGRHLEPGACC